MHIFLFKKIVLRRSLSLVVVGLVCCSGLFAQNIQDTAKVRKISEATVTASAKPAPVKQSAPLQVADRATIEKLGLQDLHEVVRGFSGVNIRDYGGIGGVKTVSIRSLGAQHTAVSYDGVAMSNVQSGQVDISRFSLDNVEQVSLFIGQSDNIFQTARLFASAGALEVRSLKPHFTDGSSAHFTAQMKASSFNTYNPSLFYEQRLGEGWSMSLNGDWLVSEGDYPFVVENLKESTIRIRNNGDVERLRSEINLHGDMGRGGKISFKGNYLYSERGLPGSVVLYNEEAHERLWDRNGFAHANYEVALGERWDLKSSLKYAYAWNRYTDEGGKYPGGKVEDCYTQQEYYGSVATQYRVNDNIRFSLAEDLFVNTLDATIPECPFPRRITSLTALAGQYKGSRLTLTASLLGTYITEEVEIGEAAEDRSRLSPAASLSYLISKRHNIRVRASFQDIFRAPTFNDLYYSRVGNTKLKSERATQYNIGLTWSGRVVDDYLEYASLSVDGFYNSVKDKIVAVPTLFIWRMRNVGKVQIAGADVNFSSTARLNLEHLISLSGNYTYQYAVDVTNPQAKNYKHQIPYTPRHAGNINVTWTNPWVNVGYLISAVGERYSLPQNVETNRIKGYMEHTVSLHRDFTLFRCALRLQGEVVNLTNKMYDVIQYYPMPGRSYRVTLKIRL